MVSSGPEGDPALGQREVLPAQPEVDRVVGEHLERHPRGDLAGPAGRPAADLLGVGLAQHLDAAERVVPVVRARGTSRSWPASSGTGWGSAPSTPPSGPGCCAACSAGRRRPSCSPARCGCWSLAERSSSTAELTAPQATTTTSALKPTVEPSPSSVTTLVTVRPVPSVSSRAHPGVGDQLDVVVRQRRVDADHLGVGLGVHHAGEAVDPVAADADAVVGRPALLVLGEVDPDRQVERVQSLLLQVVAQLLDARLVLDRPEPVRSARRPLGRVLPVPAVHQVEVLGLGVVRLEVARSRSARPARCRRGGAARRSPPGAAGTAPRRRTWCCRRRSS